MASSANRQGSGNHSLDAALAGSKNRGKFPRFFQRLAITGAEELTENAHSIFLAGLKQINAFADRSQLPE